MAVIDADTHIIECEHTWDFMEGHDPKFRPRWLPNGWEIDGNFTLREDGDPTLSMPIKELGDPAGRLKRMDELGVDTHVILPGLFLTWMTDRPEVELALCSSYNRWLADACAGEPRFQWVMVPPVLKIENAIAELEYGAKNGACGVMLRGIEGDRQLSDPYFHPLHERARALDVPIVVHAANGNRRLCELRTTNPHFWVVGPVMGAFHSLIQHRIPATFPGLKFVFLGIGRPMGARRRAVADAHRFAGGRPDGGACRQQLLRCRPDRQRPLLRVPIRFPKSDLRNRFQPLRSERGDRRFRFDSGHGGFAGRGYRRNCWRERPRSVRARQAMTATMVDADTHVLETEATWDHMDPGDRDLRPLPVESVEPGSGQEDDVVGRSAANEAARHSDE